MADKPITNKLLDFLGLGKTSGNVSLIAGAPGLTNSTNRATQDLNSISEQQKQVMAKLKKVKDPKEKQLLLNESRRLSGLTENAGEQVRQQTDLYKTMGNVTDQDLTKGNLQFALERGAKQSAELASYAVPFGKVAKGLKGAQLAASVGKNVLLPGAAAAMLSKSATDDATLGNILNAGVGGAAGAGLLHGAGGLLSKAGEKVGELASIPALKNLRPSKSQIDKFMEKTGVDIGDFVTKNKLFKKGTEQVNKLLEPLQKQFNEIATQEGVNASTKTVLDKFGPIISELKSAVQPELQSKGAKIEEVVAGLVKKYGDNIPLSELTKQRKLFDKLTGTFGREAVDAEANQLMRDILQDLVRETAESATSGSGKKLKELGSELNKLYQFQNIAKSQANLGRGSLPIGLTNALGISGGLASGFTGEGYDVKRGLQNAVIGGVVPTVANNPMAIEGATKLLSGAGNLAQKELPQMLQNILMQGASRSGGQVVSPQQAQAAPLVEQPAVDPAAEQAPPTAPTNSNLQQLRDLGLSEDLLTQFSAQETPQTQEYLNPYGKPPEELYRESFRALQAGDKQTANVLMDMYKDEIAHGQLKKDEVKQKPLSEGASKVLRSANSGSDALTQIETILMETPDVLFGQGGVGGIKQLRGQKGKQFDATMNKLKLAIKTIDTGADASGTLMQLYEGMIPAPGDDPETVAYKLGELRSFFEGAKDPAGLSTMTEMPIQ